MSRRKICVITGTRAEYGLLKRLIGGIAADPALELQLVVTGTHLAPEFGSTVREIVEDGFPIARKIEILLASDTPEAVSKSAGLALMGVAEALAQLAPDIVVLLGDRYEILAAAMAALIAQVPIAHLHGGELTEGVIDDAMRHAITKMAALHFVAAEFYRARVIGMGEPPERVFLVGGLGVDAIRNTRFADLSEVEKTLGLTLGARTLLVTFHPTGEAVSSASQFDEVLHALEGLSDVRLVFTLANADVAGRAINERITSFVARHAGRAVAVGSLGSRLYLSTMRIVDGVVGNSSSGLLEAPSLQVGTVNVGDRQKGRLRASSVIDCPPQRDAIGAAIRRLYDADFRAQLPATVNPYGDGGASERVLQVLKVIELATIKRKRFHDQPPALVEPS